MLTSFAAGATSAAFPEIERVSPLAVVAVPTPRLPVPRYDTSGVYPQVQGRIKLGAAGEIHRTVRRSLPRAEGSRRYRGGKACRHQPVREGLAVNLRPVLPPQPARPRPHGLELQVLRANAKGFRSRISDRASRRGCLWRGLSDDPLPCPAPVPEHARRGVDHGSPTASIRGKTPCRKDTVVRSCKRTFRRRDRHGGRGTKPLRTAEDPQILGGGHAGGTGCSPREASGASSPSPSSSRTWGAERSRGCGGCAGG